jgi:glucose dehydrogenase
MKPGRTHPIRIAAPIAKGACRRLHEREAIQRRGASKRHADGRVCPPKADLKLTYPNYSGALATAGNLVFIGHPDGTFSAHDAKTLQEVWSFNIGTGINAPPISFAINGKQYIAVLAGSKQSLNVMTFSPELKHSSSASMLFVFSL